MSIILIYILLVIIAAGCGLIAIFNFIRYRFKGDLTYFFILIFILAFGITVTTTLFLLDVSALNPTEVIGPVF